jgi:hypothetical protein
VSSGASYTFSTGLTNTANTITVNAAYIATISANNASYLGTVAAASYQGTANLAAAVALLPANNASYLGGTIASSYLANTSAGLSQNTSGIFVVAGTGTVVNATGVHVNSSYIATISANNASYLGTVAAASYQGTANLAAAVALLPANNASYLGGTAAASYVQNTDSRTLSGNLTFTGANLFMQSASVGGTATNYVNNFIINTNVGNASYLRFHTYRHTTGGDWTGVSTRIQQRIDVTDQAMLEFNPSGYASGVALKGGTTVQGLIVDANGQTIYQANVILGTVALSANGSSGTSGQLLTSNGTATYWSTPYTFSTGLTNTSGTITVNASYIATISANNASYLGGTAAASYALLASPTFTGTVTTANTLTIGTAAYHVANGNLGIGTSSPAATLDVVGTVNTSKANTLQQTLTDGVTISWDTSLGQVATVTLAGNRTMAAPTNLKVQTYILHVLQDATGSRTLTWNAVFKWPAGVAPTLTTTANARDIFSFVSDGTNLYGSLLPNVK